MTVPTLPTREFSVRVSDRGRPPVLDGNVPERVISVLFGTGIEKWRREWSRANGTVPDREAVVAVSDLTRGTAATTQVVPDRQLAYTVLGARADIDRILDVVGNHVTDARGIEPAVIIDDIEPVLAERGRDAVIALVDGVRAQFDDREGTVVIGCSFTQRTAPIVASLFDPVVDVEQIDHSIAAVLDRFRRDDPTTFGYVCRHWAEARIGIEQCERNYPQAKQVHAVISDPETTPRTLGMTLSGLVSLGVLDTWSETVGPTRYDLTAYSRARLWALGATVAGGGDDGAPAE